MNSRIEYRVIPVTRYTITRYSESLDGASGGVSTKGEYSNEEVAYEVAYALCKAEHERLGLPVGSDLVKYPEPVSVKILPA